MIEVIRTPDERFEGLSDYPFKPNYVENLPGYEGIRGHYVDEGNKDSKEVFLCLHGQPSWSYLYRKMIPVFSEKGYRVIAPDWLGFGKSDKPIDDSVYSFNFHRNYMLEFIKHLDLKNITLVVQDWGGVLGLTIPQDMKDRFSRLLIMNTGIATGNVSPDAHFHEWKAMFDKDRDVNVGEIMQITEPLIDENIAVAYDAPFPSAEYKAGVRRFPSLLPVTKEMEGVEVSLSAFDFWKEQWNGESFMAIGMQDKMLGPDVMNFMKTIINGCPDPLEIPEAGHFVQEAGEKIAKKALEHFKL